MAKRRPHPSRGGKPGKQPPASAPAAHTTLSVRRAADNSWALVHPRCARDRAEDLEDVQQMLEAGEVDVATDELRYLLEECSDCIAAHRLLGELALADGDVPLARGHFGYAYTAAERALPADFRGPLLYSVPENQAFLESAKGLLHTLLELGKFDLARDVLARVAHLDPQDPLGFAEVAQQLRERAKG